MLVVVEDVGRGGGWRDMLVVLEVGEPDTWQGWRRGRRGRQGLLASSKLTVFR